MREADHKGAVRGQRAVVEVLHEVLQRGVQASGGEAGLPAAGVIYIG